MADSQPPQATLSVKEIREWMENAKQNDVEGMRSQYSAQPSLLDVAQSGIGNTAMHWAAARSSEQALQFLLDQKASTSVRNSSGCTPLHSAVRYFSHM
jgi:ankyrin repeat protein